MYSKKGIRNLPEADLPGCFRNLPRFSVSVFTAVIIRLPEQLIQQIGCLLLMLLAASAEELTAGWQFYQQFYVQGHRAVQLPAVSTNFLSSLPCLQVSRALAHTLYFENTLRPCVHFWLGIGRLCQKVPFKWNAPCIQKRISHLQQRRWGCCVLPEIYCSKSEQKCHPRMYKMKHASLWRFSKCISFLFLTA